MKTFYISVTETLNRVVAVKADSYDEAYEKVENACNDGVVDLTAMDFVDRDFEDETENVEGLIADGIRDGSSYQVVS